MLTLEQFTALSTTARVEWAQGVLAEALYNGSLYDVLYQVLDLAYRAGVPVEPTA